MRAARALDAKRPRGKEARSRICSDCATASGNIDISSASATPRSDDIIMVSMALALQQSIDDVTRALPRVAPV